MENKQAVAVAVGVGAVGTALAYLGYSVYNNNADIDNLAEAENNSWWGNLKRFAYLKSGSALNCRTTKNNAFCWRFPLCSH